MIPASNTRGVLVVMEGCDRSGKTTQCKILQEHIAQVTGKPCEYLNFPNRTTPLGQIINSYLQGQVQLNNQTVHLLFSANRWELAARIEELLRSGTSIILDRYAYSGTAYSVAKVRCNNPNFRVSIVSGVGIRILDCPHPTLYFTWTCPWR